MGIVFGASMSMGGKIIGFDRLSYARFMRFLIRFTAYMCKVAKRWF